MVAAPVGAASVPDKGLRSNSLGLLSNMAIGLSSTAPAYSLAATLGGVVGHVQGKAPAMFVVAYPQLEVLNVMHLASPGSAIVSAVWICRSYRPAAVPGSTP